MTTTLLNTLINRTLRTNPCKAGPHCPWCNDADRATHRQLTRHAYPGQPAHRAEHVVQPCCCEYIRWATSYERYWGIGYSVVATGFQIHPACPHHGHLAHHNLIERMWEDPYQYALLRDPYDMDDDERQG